MHASPEFDVAIVGARVAGAATALLLARAGLKVVVLDRTTYGNDTLSTHALMRAGVMQLSRWGLLDDVIASGTPAVRRTTFFVGPDPLVISIKPAYGVDALYAPRRTVLDPMLVDAAAAAGADVRFGVTVAGLQRGDDGRVTGLVGPRRRRPMPSTSAPAWWSEPTAPARTWPSGSGAETQRHGRSAGAVAYGYWEGLDLDGYEWYFRPGVTAGAIPTNDGLTCVFVGTTPSASAPRLVPQPKSGFASLLAEGAPELVDRMSGTRAPSQLRRFPGRPGHVRQSWGPGWALVGDAGYWKDPLSAHGLTDALRDAELLARAVGRRARRRRPGAAELARLPGHAGSAVDAAVRHHRGHRRLRLGRRCHRRPPPAAELGHDRRGRGPRGTRRRLRRRSEVDVMAPPSRRSRRSGTILGVWAHPDDEAYLSAGLMARARRNGQRVVVVTATPGELGTDDPSRWPPARLGGEAPPRAGRQPGRARGARAPLARVARRRLRPRPRRRRRRAGGRRDRRRPARHDRHLRARRHDRPSRSPRRLGLDDVGLGRLEPGRPGSSTPRSPRSSMPAGARSTTTSASGPSSRAARAPPTTSWRCSSRLDGEELDQKVVALRAHASQTTAIVDRLGEATFRLWWEHESFVAASRPDVVHDRRHHPARGASHARR